MFVFSTKPNFVPTLDPKEPLWLIRFLGEHLFRIAYVRWCLRVIFVLFVILLLPIFYYCVFKLTTQQIFNFAPFTFMGQYVSMKSKIKNLISTIDILTGNPQSVLY